VNGRKLNITSLGFDVVVIGASDKTNKVIADLLEKKIATEEVGEPEECKHCNQFGGHICEPCEGKWHR
jgi:hypothetical protein